MRFSLVVFEGDIGMPSEAAAPRSTFTDTAPLFWDGLYCERRALTAAPRATIDKGS